MTLSAKRLFPDDLRSLGKPAARKPPDDGRNACKVGKLGVQFRDSQKGRLLVKKLKETQVDVDTPKCTLW